MLSESIYLKTIKKRKKELASILFEISKSLNRILTDELYISKKSSLEKSISKDLTESFNRVLKFQTDKQSLISSLELNLSKSNFSSFEKNLNNLRKYLNNEITDVIVILHNDLHINKKILKFDKKIRNLISASLNEIPISHIENTIKKFDELLKMASYDKNETFFELKKQREYYTKIKQYLKLRTHTFSKLIKIEQITIKDDLENIYVDTNIEKYYSKLIVLLHQEEHILNNLLDNISNSLTSLKTKEIIRKIKEANFIENELLKEMRNRLVQKATMVLEIKKLHNYFLKIIT